MEKSWCYNIMLLTGVVGIMVGATHVLFIYIAPLFVVWKR